jgi:hypothetical protein
MCGKREVVMDEEVRQVGSEWAMAKVMAEVERRRLVPLVLIAQDGDHRAVIPCGPCDPGQVRDLLAALLRGWDEVGIEILRNATGG